MPAEDGISGAVLGLGDDRSPHAFGDAHRLPAGEWRIEPGDFDMDAAVLGFFMGAYRYQEFKAPPREPATLVVGAEHDRAMSHARSAYLVRDLVNAPANLLGPSELAGVAMRWPRPMARAPCAWRATNWREIIPLSPRSDAARRESLSWLDFIGKAAPRLTMRRYCRCAARACASIRADTTSSRPPECCG